MLGISDYPSINIKMKKNKQTKTLFAEIFFHQANNKTFFRL
jgi:hypothetical protein